MSIQASNSYQSIFQSTPFIKTNRASGYTSKKFQGMSFLLSLITNSEKLRKKKIMIIIFPKISIGNVPSVGQ
ncbi:MAG: hypothetical protein S4CHLAM6_09700 [Chlamydiae bacterium]|nr:hypothetical protein [Chlamydiota bacterium]